MTEHSKYQGLDLLRAIAIVMVLVWHNMPQEFRVGWVGVDLFFILSGFLIGSILFSSIPSGRFSYFEYMRSRLLRIYPLYIVSVLLYLIDIRFRGYAGTSADILKIFTAHSVFFQTVVYDIWHVDLPFYQITWSLVVEMIFYATIPFILWALINLRMVWVGIAVILVFFLGLRFYLSSAYLPDDNNWQFFLFLKPYYRYDELIYGVAVAYAVRQRLDILKKCSLALALVILTISFIYIWKLTGADKHPSMALLTRDGILIPSVLALGFALMVYALYDKKISSPVINVVARLAYPLYLMHMFVLHYFHWFSAFLVLSFVAALICSYFIEYPFIRMYKKKTETRLVAELAGRSQAN
ncbi:acyltransferase family protein [Pseudomonas sp. NPDC087598]|uniref:acyltransferase family protein n=1 Tax=unclassified Pseudomonas TaxID=196821 RepID=UPI0019118521|nr:acyltransferase [Pseudomonas sp. TH06]MBK5529972.1 acyltransferase [Pseudomonas sp. TH06]